MDVSRRSLGRMVRLIGLKEGVTTKACEDDIKTVLCDPISLDLSQTQVAAAEKLRPILLQSRNMLRQIDDDDVLAMFGEQLEEIMQPLNRLLTEVLFQSHKLPKANIPEDEPSTQDIEGE